MSLQHIALLLVAPFALSAGDLLADTVSAFSTAGSVSRLPSDSTAVMDTLVSADHRAGASQLKAESLAFALGSNFGDLALPGDQPACPDPADPEAARTPEPQSLFLLGTGVLSLAGLLRRRLG